MSSDQRERRWGRGRPLRPALWACLHFQATFMEGKIDCDFTPLAWGLFLLIVPHGIYADFGPFGVSLVAMDRIDTNPRRLREICGDDE